MESKFQLFGARSVSFASYNYGTLFFPYPSALLADFTEKDRAIKTIESGAYNDLWYPALAITRNTDEIANYDSALAIPMETLSEIYLKQPDGSYKKAAELNGSNFSFPPDSEN